MHFFEFCAFQFPKSKFSSSARKPPDIARPAIPGTGVFRPLRLPPASRRENQPLGPPNDLTFMAISCRIDVTTCLALSVRRIGQPIQI